MQTNMLESGVNFKDDSHVESDDCFMYWIRVSDGIFDPLKNFHVHSEESLYSGNK